MENKRILCLEDVATHTKLIAARAIGLGFSVDIRQTVDDMREKVITPSPDLAILDLRVPPNHDPKKTISTFLNVYPNTPYVFYTAAPEDLPLAALKNPNFHGVIDKKNPSQLIDFLTNFRDE